MSFNSIHRKFISKTLAPLFRYLAYIVLCGVLVACRGNNDETLNANSNETGSEGEVAAIIPSTELSNELEANRLKWNSYGISSYEVEMQKICFCPPDALKLMIFNIEDNEIVSVHYADTNETVNPNFYDNFNSINGLFELAEYALEQDPDEISILYDDEFGYIKQIAIDYKSAVADDELTIIASGLRRI